MSREENLLVHVLSDCVLVIVIVVILIIPVPSGCVDVAWDREVFLAKPKKTSAEECERRADRCYWADDWDPDRRDLEEGTCYYRAGKGAIISV